VKIIAIRSRKDFLRVQREAGLTVKNRNMVIMCKNTDRKYIKVAVKGRPTEFARIGLVVTKRIDKRAVVRNRIKRRIRAISHIILANHCNLYINHVDYVIVLRRNISDVSYSELLQNVKKLFNEIRIGYGQHQ
jgi:ribonuclease P protein component